MAAATKTYEYSVRDRAGKLTSGKLEAANEAVLVSKLKQMGYAPVSVRETGGGGGLNMEIKLPFGNGVKLADLAIMSRQFATMINSGLSLLRALTILADQTSSPKLRETLAEVRSDVETGVSLSNALAKHPKVFPPLMVNMCRAGEVGGFLDGVLLRIAENYESEVKLQRKIKSAMTYPTVILCFALLAVAGMLIFIVPVFEEMFDSLGGTLPAATQVLVFLSNQMAWFAPTLLVTIVASVVVWNRIKNNLRVRETVDPLKLKLPVFGGLAQKVALSRLTRNLGTMISAGVPILQALDIVADTTGNIVVTKAVRDVQQSVRQGESLAAPLAQHKVFPAMVVQMLAVGEDTGALDTMLGKISDFYDQEVEATTEALTALLEPLMIAVLGGIVGAMIIALYMPIFSIFEQIE
ncbi:type II secretion system F family protein [Aquipuribacter sp. SD81]|uniref:type II secretion system F family protein n=1 Tax=Aquipuribacter sp. SD81 TaxID=3127703 RepID=UPI003015BE5C